MSDVCDQSIDNVDNFTHTSETFPCLKKIIIHEKSEVYGETKLKITYGGSKLVSIELIYFDQVTLKH